MWGPMAEAMLCSYLEENHNYIPTQSRGLVVLFEEPLNPKIIEILGNHGIAMEDRQSVGLVKEDLEEGTLVLTMLFRQKVKIIEDFDFADTVYTVSEFAGEEADLLGPYGGERREYEAFYRELTRILPKVVGRIIEEEK